MIHQLDVSLSLVTVVRHMAALLMRVAVGGHEQLP
jgi:hypothetical protein